MDNPPVHKTEIATITYLLTHGKVCFAPKKQDVHKKGGEALSESKLTLNGYGGKKEKEDASVRDTACREVEGEARVIVRPENLIPAARLRFYWPGNTTDRCDMDCYVFFAATWEGDPVETDEMGAPEYFTPEEIPYDRMLPADRLFLPRILSGERIVADIFFQKNPEGKGLQVKEFIVRDEPLEV